MLAVCPRCQRANPHGSAYCWFDGGSLLSAQNGLQKLAKDFIFPSGRRCQTLEDFAQACQDEWSAAREMLSKDAFRQYFIAMSRLDLVRLTQEVMQQPNPDVGLSRFIDGLPVVRTNVAKLDFHPRRFTLGRLPTGDRREIEIVLVNQGKGTLQGTVSITEGADWLSFPEFPGASQTAVQTAAEQRIRLTIDATKLKSAQSYAGQLMVVTSGGVAEVPIRFDLVARPFGKAPFQGVKTPRELAEKMRTFPKQAGPLLESGDVQRWFAANNWDYPVQGPIAQGVAGVQQFFEAMGLSRPPQLHLSQNEIRISGSYPDVIRAQIALQTTSRKWVYGEISSDQPWLKILTPKAMGPQTATFSLEADPTQILSFPPTDAKLHLVGNGGQKLDAVVMFDIKNIPKPGQMGRWKTVLTYALAFMIFRLAFVIVADYHARPAALLAAVRGVNGTPDPAWNAVGGWLALPWASLLAGFDSTLATASLPADSMQGSTTAREFRQSVVGAMIREIALWTWWLGPVAMVLLLYRLGESGVRNIPWALIAGSVAGVLLAGTAACMFLAIEILPHAIWSLLIGRAGPGWFVAWIVLACTCWTAIGALFGIVHFWLKSRIGLRP